MLRPSRGEWWLAAGQFGGRVKEGGRSLWVMDHERNESWGVCMAGSYDSGACLANVPWEWDGHARRA